MDGDVVIPVGDVTLQATFTLPPGARGVVAFAHGSGSGRHSPRNRYVAGVLNDGGFGIVLADLLTEEEERIDLRTGELRFDIDLLARRVTAVVDWLAAILALEARGLFCSKDFSKSILYSVAAPGASQHLALVAFDVAEFTNPSVRATLARHGWFQTVRSDLPHFTFLGAREQDLPDLGLERVGEHGQTFWLPAVS